MNALKPVPLIKRPAALARVMLEEMNLERLREIRRLQLDPLARATARVEKILVLRDELAALEFLCVRAPT